VEQRGKPKEAEPKAAPGSPQPPTERVRPETQKRGGAPGAVEQRGKGKEAEPKEKAEPRRKAIPERPKKTPAEDNVIREERGNRR
jgi:hypothetical protein